MNHKIIRTTSNLMLTVGGLAVFGCCSVVRGDPPDDVRELSEMAAVFVIERHQGNRPEHKNANIAVVETGDPDRFGLAFQQTMESGHKGKGMLCPDARILKKPGNVPDVALTCHQHVGVITETLSVGTVDSNFCNSLREELGEDDPQLIMTPAECEEQYGKGEVCICFNIAHEVTKLDSEPQGGGQPPTSGSGSGGRHP